MNSSGVPYNDLQLLGSRAARGRVRVEEVKG